VASVSAVDSDLVTSDLIEVRRSGVHGLGVFAAKPISKGTRIIEYVGERVSHDEADRRYEEKDVTDSHTFLFIVDSKTVIDAGTDGNDARFFNHSCDPNCESTVAKKRVYIEAIRDIEPGTELTYDYQIYREKGDPENIDEVFACRCGFPNCRGTMLWPPEEPKRKRKAKKKAVAKSRGNAKSTRGGKSKSGAGASARTGSVKAKGGGGSKGGAKSAGRKAKGNAGTAAQAKGNSRGVATRQGSSSGSAKSKGGSRAKGKSTGKSGGPARAKAGAKQKGKRGGRRG
jgi:uncharacterized protein